MLQLCQVAILARLLGPREFGWMAAALVAAGLAQNLADFGLGAAVIRAGELTASRFSTYFWAVTAAGGLVVVVLAASAKPLEILLGQTGLARLILLLCPAFFTLPAVGLLAALLQREMRFARLAACELAGALASLCTAWALAVGGAGVLALVGAQWAYQGVRLAGYAAATRGRWNPLLGFRLRELRQDAAFGGFQTGERVLGYLRVNLDKWLAVGLLGAVQLGFYAVAFQLMARPAQLLAQSAARVSLPVFSRVRTSPGHTGRVFLGMMRRIAFFSFPAFFLLSATARPVTDLLLGPGWEPSAAVLRPLALYGVLIALSNPGASLLLAGGRADISFGLNVYATAVNFAAVWVGARWGIAGIAWAVLGCGCFLMFPWTLWIGNRFAGVSPGTLAAALAPAAALSAVAGATAWGLFRFFPWPGGHWGLAASWLGGTAVFAGGAALFFPAGLREARDLVWAGQR